MREEFRGYIRETQGYNKMILSGDENIVKALSDPQKMSGLLSFVVDEILVKNEARENSKGIDQPQRSNENVMQQKENLPAAMR